MTVKLKSIDEILDEADLIYRYNWTCVDARIYGENPPACLESEIVLQIFLDNNKIKLYI